MPRGAPDYNIDPNAVGKYGTDVYELAARLGSPYAMLRSGHVLRIDDFEDGITKWVQSVSGTATITSSTTYPYSGTKNMLLKDGNAAFNSPLAIIRVPLISVGIYSLDFLWKPVAVSANPMGDFIVFIDYILVDKFYETDIIIDPNTGEIGIVADVAGVSTYIIIEPGLGTFIDQSYVINYHYIHFSIDLVNLTYNTLIVDNHEYNLKSYKLPVNAASLTPGIDFQFYSVSNGYEHENYIDNVIITVDEL